jgi:hypothetical protein
MKKSVICSFAALLVGVATAYAADPPAMPEMPAPQPQHEWLKKFVGQWETESEISIPGQEPIKSKGTETVRSLGGFWVVSDLKCDFMGQSMNGVMTVGYDPESGKYIGTWIDSMGSYLWKYEGSLDESGKKLTLESEGPCPMQGGKLAKMRDVVEFQGDDTRTMTSSVQGEDGKWQPMMKMTAKRKK